MYKSSNKTFGNGQRATVMLRCGALSLSLLLAACGGGGGGSNTSPAVSAPSPLPGGTSVVAMVAPVVTTATTTAPAGAAPGTTTVLPPVTAVQPIATTTTAVTTTASTTPTTTSATTSTATPVAPTSSPSTTTTAVAVTTTYSLTPTVTGLGVGKTLVLQNGADTLGFASNTSSSFATKLVTGASYAITVKTDPAGQSCTVTNGSGTVATANVTNVAVSCSAVVASTGLSISAASVSMNTITVTGVGFGSKAQAAPYKFEDFEGGAIGATPKTVGYTEYGGFGGTTTVDNSQAFGGSKSLRHLTHFGPVTATTGGAIEESFPHIAVTGFRSQEMYLSYRMRFNTNGGSIFQLKFNRGGVEDTTWGANVLGSPCYGGEIFFYSSYYSGNGRNSADQSLSGGLQGGVRTPNGTSAGKRDEGWVGDAWKSNGGSVLPIPESTWVQVEEYYRLADVGQANGEHVTWVNGNLQFNRHDIQTETKVGQMLNCSYLVIGMDYYINSTSTKGIEVWYDDHYFDTSRARLVLANAATWSATTIRSPQPATMWSATSIVAQLKTAGFASGSDAWLYVVRADGTTSAGWKIRLN